MPSAQQPGYVYENGIADASGARNNPVIRSIDVAGEALGGNIKSIGSHMLMNGASVQQRNPGSVFTPGNEYSYVAEAANAALEARIRANGGWQNVALPE